MPIKCLIDGTEHYDEKVLHYYLKKLKVKRSDYYERFYPRFDKQTGEKIPFKEFSSYFNTDFLNKNSLKAFCKNNPKEGYEWGKSYLEARAKEKGVNKAFHHVELRSLICPSVLFFEKLGGYNKMSLSIGLTPIFDYKNEIEFQFQDLAGGIVRCDTREQKPIPFKTIKTKTDTIHYGDYSIEKPYHQGIFIEKKSIADFAHSFGKDKERLEREFNRCAANDDYMVVLVQCPLSKALSFNYLWEMKYSKVSPEFVFANMRDLLHRYNNLQFLFIDKDESERVILNLFKMGQNVRKTDLQYVYDLKLI